MANQADALKLLVKIADNQQKIINKLAQAQGLAPQGLQPPAATKNKPYDVVMAALPAAAKAAVKRLEVDPVGHVVSVWEVAPGQGTDQLIAAVQSAVQHAQLSGVLPGASYKVQVVG